MTDSIDQQRGTTGSYALAGPTGPVGPAGPAAAGQIIALPDELIAWLKAVEQDRAANLDLPEPQFTYDADSGYLRAGDLVLADGWAWLADYAHAEPPYDELPWSLAPKWSIGAAGDVAFRREGDYVCFRGMLNAVVRPGELLFQMPALDGYLPVADTAFPAVIMDPGAVLYVDEGFANMRPHPCTVTVSSTGQWRYLTDSFPYAGPGPYMIRNQFDVVLSTPSLQQLILGVDTFRYRAA